VDSLTMRRRCGVSLVEILLGIIIVTIVSIGTLSYFAYGLGNVNKQGNRRAALERARQRLEQLMAVKLSDLPPDTGQLHWCTAEPCGTGVWTTSPTPLPGPSVSVDDLPSQRTEVSAQWLDDPSAGTSILDTIELGVKVWFVPGQVDDELHRVYLKTLRTP
jgi:type II secretory pathway pseudopilin PulG